MDVDSYLDDMQHGHEVITGTRGRGRVDALDEAAELVLARMQRNRAMPPAAHATQPRRRTVQTPSAAAATTGGGGGRRAPTLERPSAGEASHRPPEKASVDDVVFLRLKEKAFLGDDPERRGLTIAVSEANQAEPPTSVLVDCRVQDMFRI